MKYFILAIITLFTIESVKSQEATGSVYGKVIDKFTNEPLIGANVIIIGSNFGAATNVQGEFSINNIPPNVYQIRASVIGYNSITKTDISVMPGRPAQVDFELTVTAIELEGVVVQSDYFTRNPIEVGSIKGFSNEEIRRSAGGFEDVVRAVSVLPGVAQADPGRNDLIVRGGGPSENLYLIDGIPVQNINHFGTQGATGGPLSYVNLDFVSGTTFSTGGFSVLNGDKLSSVLTIDFREGRKDKIGGKGTISATQFGLDLEGPVTDNSTFIFSARRSYLDFIFKAADFSFVPEYYDGFAKYDWKLDNRNSISFLLIAAFDNVKYFNDTEDQRYDNSRILGSNQTQYATGISFRHLFNNGFLNLTLNRNYVDYNTQQNDSLLNPIFINNSLEKENTLKADLTYKLSKITEVNAGVSAKIIDFETDIFVPEFVSTFGDSIPTTTINAQENYGKLAAYTNLNFLLFDKLNLNLGIRADYFSPTKTKTFLSPRFSTSYRLTDITSVTFSTGVYHQAPSYIWLVGNEINLELKNIRVNQYVLGLDQYFSADALFRIEGFLKDYFDYPTSLRRTYLIMANTGAGFAGSDENFASFGLDPLNSDGTGLARGFEVSLQKKLSEKPYYGILSLTYSEANFTALDKVERIGSYDQTWIFNISGGYKIDEEWEVATKFRYSTGKPYTPFNNDGTQSVEQINSIRFPVNHSLDVRVDKRWFFAGWTLITYIDIQNIYNRKNITGIRWDQRTQAPELNETIGILPSVGISAMF
ncbi:MAG: TonB-dependent receptor [Ignavibacteriaceae bacterium]|nr:TonB-dependent receptor [Ignavibacteriaceae bacterium]